MLRFVLFSLLFSLLFWACGQHELYKEGTEDDILDNDSSSSFISSSSSFVYSSSSLLEIPSSSSSSSSENSEDSSSSSLETPSSSSVDECDFEENDYIEAECSYDETITITDKIITLGQQAKLYFANNASLRLEFSTLNIEGGAELHFGDNSQLRISSQSVLNIRGEEHNPVVLAALEGSRWDGVKIFGNNANINYMNLSGAGIGIDFGGNAVLKNSEIYNNEYGIKQYSFFSSGNVSGNRFYSNTYDAEVSLEVALTLGSSEQFAGTLHLPDIEFINEGVTLPAFKYYFARRIRVNISNGDSLKIEAGAHFYFSDFSSITVATGSIKAIGTENNPIIFETANVDDFWGSNWAATWTSVANIDGPAFSFEQNCSAESKFEHFKVLRAKVAFYNSCSHPLELSNGTVTYRDDFYGNTLAGQVKVDPSVFHEQIP